MGPLVLFGLPSQYARTEQTCVRSLTGPTRRTACCFPSSKKVSSYAKRSCTRIEGGFCGDLTGGRAAARLSSHGYVRAARRVCLAEYCSRLGITAGGGVGSDLAAATPPASPAFATLCRTPQIIFVSSQARELPSIHQGKIGVSCRGTLLECR